MTRWIAEIGSNHNADLSRALALVDSAAAAGFTDVKTQAFRVNQLFAPEALAANPELRARERLEVPWEWHKPLANRCKEHGIDYGVTVFHASDVRRAATEADWLKVSSYSLLDGKLLEAVALQPKPMILSTGMATEAEVAAAVDGIEAMHPELTLLHCVSAYPAPPHEANLRSIPYMRERFGVPVGWSDHTCSEVVVRRAASVFGATAVELHFDLGDGLGVEAAHSWTPESFLELFSGDVHTDEGFYQCDGKRDRKAPTMSEEAERAWRADPSDGMRPLLDMRAQLAAGAP